MSPSPFFKTCKRITGCHDYETRLLVREGIHIKKTAENLSLIIIEERRFHQRHADKPFMGMTGSITTAVPLKTTMTQREEDGGGGGGDRKGCGCQDNSNQVAVEWNLVLVIQWHH